MKSPLALTAGLATLLALSACGQTGPLYMPKIPPRPGTPAAAAAAAAPATTPATTTTVVLSPPAPAAGVTLPAANSNSNNSQAPIQPAPTTQQ